MFPIPDIGAFVRTPDLLLPPVTLSQNYVGLDDVKLETPDLVEDYLEMRRLHRSPGYQARGRVFRERLTYLGGTDGE
jgi:hypothetical protein